MTRDIDLQIGNIIYPEANGIFYVLPCYSDDIKDAWDLVEWCKRNKWSLNLTEHADPKGDYVVTVWKRHIEGGDDFLEYTARADTAQLAICRVILLAVKGVSA